MRKTSKATWIHLLDQKKKVIFLANSDAANINEMREKFVLASLAQPVNLPPIQKVPAKNDQNLSRIEVAWEIDLRPTPNSQPYLKEFIISNITGKTFSGTFYGSEFTGGEINGSWDRIYFAFMTGDKDSSYYHSGYIER